MKKYLFILFLFPLALKAQTIDQLLKKADEKYKKGEYAEAAGLYDETIIKFPQYYGPRISKLYCLFILKDNAGMDNAIEEYTETFAGNWDAIDALSDYLRNTKQFQANVDMMNMVMRRFQDDTLPMQMLTRRALAHAYYDVLDFENAKAQGLWAYNSDTTNTSNMYTMAAIYDGIGMYDSAMYFYEKILSIEPKCTHCYNAMGFTYNNLGEYEKALKCFNALFKLIKEDKDLISLQSAGLLYSNNGFALLKMGRFKEAYKSFDKSIEYFPSNSYVYKNRALAYIAQKKYKEACIDLYYALSLGFATQYGDEVDKLIAAYCQ